MASGRSIQLNKQIGEYLVACELARRGLLVATFSGNVPDYDILAADSKGASIPIQVKTIRGGQWQFSADKFVKVMFKSRRQILGKNLRPRIPRMICVMVLATEYGKDEFFILRWEQLRRIVISKYRSWLASRGGVRPRNRFSLHCSADPRDLRRFKNQWSTITKGL
jgi:hypothetical protein